MTRDWFDIAFKAFWIYIGFAFIVANVIILWGLLTLFEVI